MGSITPMDTTTMSMLLAMAGPQGWAELPTGILHSIIHLLSSTRDVLAFIATCPTWRAAFMEAKPTFCEQQAPPTSHDPKLRPVKQRCPPLWCSSRVAAHGPGQSKHQVPSPGSGNHSTRHGVRRLLLRPCHLRRPVGLGDGRQYHHDRRVHRRPSFPSTMPGISEGGRPLGQFHQSPLLHTHSSDIIPQGVPPRQHQRHCWPAARLASRER